MKEFLLLYKTSNNNYLPFKQGYQNSLSSLFSMLFGGDFRRSEKDFLTQVVSCYNAHFIYHDFQNKLLYMGFGDWLIDSEIDGPSDEEFLSYLNESNSCKMSVDNYLEFRQKWVQLKKDLLPFAIIYRDNNDWVYCKGFDSQEEMELFIKNYQPEITY